MALDLVDHAEALSAINTDQDGAVARDVNGLWAAHGGRSDLVQATHLILPQIIDVRGHQSGVLAANWYDGIDPSSKFRAKPYADVPEEQISKMIDWALHAPGEQPPQDRLVGSAQRLVRSVSRNTVVRNAEKEGVKYARHAKEDACAYCRALSLRGTGREDRKYLYDTAESAKFRKSDGEKYHTNCGCEPVPIRAGMIWTPPGYTAEWTNQYDEAAKATPAGPKYFQRVAAQMRANEPKPEPEEAEGEGADVIEIRKPDPARVAARASLEKAATFDEVKKAAVELLPNTMVSFGNEFQYKKADAGSPGLWDLKAPEVWTNLKDMTRAADDVLTKYPDLKLEILRTVDESTFSNQPLYKNPYATAGSYFNGTEYENGVNVNRNWLTNIASLHDSWQAGLDTGFHYHGEDDNPIYNIVIHEMGHVMQRNAENVGVHINDHDVNRALSTYFITQVDEKPDTPGKIERYRDWLHDNLSGYSTHQGSTAINGREALAEAFADVEVNGENAHETSVVLHGLLVDAYTRSLEGDAGGLAPAV